MSARFERVEPCIHGQDERHQYIPIEWTFDELGGDQGIYNPWCDGGSRTPLKSAAPDYEAAIKHDWKVYDKAKSVEERAGFVRQIVDAALAGKVVFESE